MVDPPDIINNPFAPSRQFEKEPSYGHSLCQLQHSPCTSPSCFLSLKKRASIYYAPSSRTFQRYLCQSFLYFAFIFFVLTAQPANSHVIHSTSKSTDSILTASGVQPDVREEVSKHWFPLQDSTSVADRSSIEDQDGEIFDRLYADIQQLDEDAFRHLFQTLGRQRETFLNREASSTFASFSRRSQLLNKRRLTKRASVGESDSSSDGGLSQGERIGFGILVPILVILSGIFAGLTLGYMSLDETQLHVLSTTGTDIQRTRAKKIIPIRKDGHLLLTTLLIANMITNETLPIIFDPLIDNPIGSVVASIVLIVIFAELIPQSTCSRYGLVIGAYMAWPTRMVILILWPIAFPVSRLLHLVLGPHHGIVYRRAELKELVTMHAASGGRGGDLKGDTVMIVGGALDLQEKVVKQAMTPIDQVFMLPFSARLDYPTLEKIVRSGHSRIPIYQEIEVPVHQGNQPRSGSSTPTRKMLPLFSSFTRKTSTGPGAEKDSQVKTSGDGQESQGNTSIFRGSEKQDGSPPVKTTIRKKIVGVLLVKSCVLLDPEDAVPVSSMIINALPTVPGDEPLLNVLNAFQEGRSHMAIVSGRPRRAVTDSIADLGSASNLYHSAQGPPVSQAPGASAAPRVDGLGDIDEEKHIEGAEMGRTNTSSNASSGETAVKGDHSPSKKRRHLWGRRLGLGKGEDELMEQTLPSDATITDEKAQKAASGVPPLLTQINSRASANDDMGEPHGWPLGIITLEDVLEELLGEEILDEYDERGNQEQDFRTLNPPPSPERLASVAVPNCDNAKEDVEIAELDGKAALPAAPMPVTATDASSAPPVPVQQGGARKNVLRRLGISRQRSTGREGEIQRVEKGQQTDEPFIGAGIVRRGTEPEKESRLVSSPKEGTSDMTSVPAGLDYFGDGFKRRLPRSSSVPPPTSSSPSAADNIADVTESRSRPPSPSFAAAAPASSTPLFSPQPNRPIVIRTQDPSSGVQKTTIANESLLRGRQNTAPGSTTPLGSRSQTPAGAGSSGNTTSVFNAAVQGNNKGSRFKSQAAFGVGNGFSGGAMMTSQRSRGVPPHKTQHEQDLSASVGTLDGSAMDASDVQSESGDAVSSTGETNQDQNSSEPLR